MKMSQSRRWLFAAAIAAVFSLVCGATAVVCQRSRSAGCPICTASNSSAGINGHALLMCGLVVCALGLVFGMVIYSQLKNMPVHRSMLEVSELIYATCKTYLMTQIKFIMLLWVFIGAVIFIYFRFLADEDHADARRSSTRLSARARC